MLFHRPLAAIAAFASLTQAAPPYSTWTADSFITRGVNANRAYANAVLYRGFETAFNASSDVKYYNYLKTQIDTFVSSAGVLGNSYTVTKYSLDDILIGRNLLYLYQRTKMAKYKTAAQTLRNQLNSHPRTPGGGFWHRKAPYPNQMWLDGIYMASPFYAQWTNFFDAKNITAWNDIVLQYDLVERWTAYPNSHLLVHGYDESKAAVWADPTTGRCPHVWDRALGWYAMALVDVLDYFPKSHAGYNRLLGYLEETAQAVKDAQDISSGGWWLIMTPGYAGRKGNYIESSATAMFTYALLKGVRLGYLDRVTYEPVARKAYALLASKFALATGSGGTLNWEGTVEVGSLASNGSFEYYVSVPLQQNDFKGAGPFIYASSEFERL